MRKKIIFILAGLSFILCLFFIQESYAKYLTATNESTTMSIARWRILVNNKDIRNGSTANAIITPIFNGNDNIAENIIAPTSEGYFDLVIDVSEADVSFKYKIEMDVNVNSTVTDLIATGYQIDGGEVIALNKDNQIIENTVLYSQNRDTINIRVHILWDDGETAEMDNDMDTQATLTPSNSAMMDVHLSFIQLAN